MSDDSDETGGGTLVHGPWSGDSTYELPPIPDFIDTIPPPEDIPEAPPETPEETTMELPAVPAAPDPVLAMRSEGIAAPVVEEPEGEYAEGEYEQRRSLADRLGDWLEFRLEMARANHESEAPFREAEIARKAALIEGRTAQEVAMMEQNGKLHAAMMKAKGDKAAAREKASGSVSGSGMGADKGRSKASGGGGSSRGGGGTGPSRTNSSPGPNKPGASRGPNSGTSGSRSGAGSTGSGGGGKDRKKGPERSSGSHAAGSGRNGSSGGSKGSQAGSGGSGRSGSSKGDGNGRAERGPASSARAERARGRQDRAGVRQSGRQERHTAGLADRTKDRDQARANRQQAWEDRRAKRAERDAARKAKREAAASTTPGRTTLGQALGEEAQRRWDKRRSDAKAAADAKDGKAAGAEKVSLTKEKDSKAKSTDGKDSKSAKDGPEGASGAAKDGKAGDEPAKDSKAGDGASDSAKKRRRFRRRRTAGTGRAGRRGRTRRTGRTGRAGHGRTGRSGRPADSPFGAEESTPTVEWPDRPTHPPHTDTKSGEDDIVDADIVPDGPAAVTTGVRGLPPAPEPHTARPGTSRPTSTEGNSVSSSQVSRPSGGGGLAAQHRTDITFDEYLMEMAKIGLQAGADQERAEELMKALGKVADALREMAADLVGDHNVSTAVTDLIGDLADAAGRMKAQAERCAEECGIAWEAARLAATMVARVYGEDMAAKEDAGLKYASAAAHHD
ncbi:ATP/GTP-binding protein [Streptomyces sp. NPDC053513]|uniref:ATP/GTP-binding protein n=1 Tax=unclassified Streptomyces TaxID=2593676 RepID=UPI0037CF48A6